MIRFVTIGPVPVLFVAKALEQVVEQGWEPQFMAFAGMGQLQAAIATPGRHGEAMPAFVVICGKEEIPGTELTLPKIDLNAK